MTRGKRHFNIVIATDGSPAAKGAVTTAEGVDGRPHGHRGPHGGRHNFGLTARWCQTMRLADAIGAYRPQRPPLRRTRSR